MKYSPRFTYTFTPASNKLDLSSNSGFAIQGLLAVVDITASVVIYAVGSTGYSAISGGNVLTLSYNCSSLAATDSLVFMYDDGVAGGTSAVQQIQGVQSANVTGSITSASSIVGPLTVSNFNVVTVQVYGTYTGVSFTFQGSPDNSNWFTLQGSRVDNGQNSTGLVVGSTANLAWDIPIGAWLYFRVQATAWASGTASISMGAQTFAYDPCPATIDQGPVQVGATIPSYTAPVLVGGTDGTAARPANYTLKGNQGTYALNAQQLKDSGRNQTNYYTATPVASSATETSVSLTGFKGGAAVTATATPVVVTTGKTYRIEAITLVYVATTAVGYGRVTLRIAAGATASASSPAVMSWFVGTSAFTAGVTQTVHLDIADGIEIPSGYGFAFSIVGLSSTGTAVAAGYLGISAQGFEY